MNREVCLFDKFSYCKNGVRCLRIHLKEVCLNRECDYRNCNKRHPNLVKSSWKRVSVDLAQAVGTVIGLQNLLRSKIRKFNLLKTTPKNCYNKLLIRMSSSKIFKRSCLRGSAGKFKVYKNKLMV